jgi:hypothetical protein
VVHHLAREVRDPDVAVEARGAQPHRPAVFLESPESHVVAAPWALPDRPLERDVLRPAPADEVRAHWSGEVRPVEEHASGVAQAAAQADPVRLRPTCGPHRRFEVGLGPDERQVDRVGRNPLGRVRQAR